MDDIDEFIKWLNKEGKKHINEIFKNGNIKIKIMSNINEIFDDLNDLKDCEKCDDENCPIKKNMKKEETMIDIIENENGCNICMDIGEIDKKLISFEATDNSIILNIENHIYKEIPLKFRPSEKISALLKNGILTIKVKKMQ